jgi:hypothetical protein
MLFTDAKDGIPFVLAGWLISILTSALLAWRYHFVEKALRGCKAPVRLTAAYLACLCAHFFPQFQDNLFTSIFNNIPFTSILLTRFSARHPWFYGILYQPNFMNTCLGLLALFACFVVFCWFIRLAWPAARAFAASLSAAERRCLWIGGAVAVLALLVIYNLTGAFTTTLQADGRYIYWNVLYTTDSGNLYKDNYLLNIKAGQNDIRNPLFTLFALPFSLPVLALSKLFFFLPNIEWVLWQAMQCCLLLISFLLLARLLEGGGAEPWFFCLAAASYPTLFFALTVEQYIVPVFWLILLLYACLAGNPRAPLRRLLFFGAAGSLLSSGILFPLLLPPEKGRVKKLRALATAGLWFFALCAVCGKLGAFAPDRFIGLTQFMGAASPHGVTFADSLLQYTHFLAACLLPPHAGLQEVGHSAWRAFPTPQVNPIGLLVFGVAALGFFLTKKSALSRAAAGWIAFSFVLLAVAGWGAPENGMALYTLYFSWAFLVLIHQALHALLGTRPKLFHAVTAALAGALLLYNLRHIGQIIAFSMRYYPV